LRHWHLKTGKTGETLEHRVHPSLKDMITEASLALARLDSDRLEELGLSFEALTRGLGNPDENKEISFECEARDTVQQMAVFSRVLEATRSNLNVMQRLREMRARRVECLDSQDNPLVCGSGLHGDN
jgi:hypothetical protein